jgi:hypothetical protein
MVNVEWTPLIVRGTILCGLIGAPCAAWSQATPSQVQASAAPVQQTETASDARSVAFTLNKQRYEHRGAGLPCA